jgi:Ca2+-binding EF-hand superfamily protein
MAELVSVELRRSAASGSFGMALTNDGFISALTDEPDGSAGAAELAGVAEVLGGRIVAVDGQDVGGRGGRPTVVELLSEVPAGHTAEFWIERPPEGVPQYDGGGDGGATAGTASPALMELFASFDAGSGDGFLDRGEVFAMLNQYFEADWAYVDGLLDNVGTADGSTGELGITADTFPDVWAFLGQPMPNDAKEQGVAVGQSDRAGGGTGGGDEHVEAQGAVATAEQEFARHDANGDGVLDARELEALIGETMGYEYDDAYIRQVLQQYGRPSGPHRQLGVDLQDFVALCKALGHPLAAAAAAAVTEGGGGGGGPADAPPPPGGSFVGGALAFDRFDRNGDDVLDRRELSDLLDLLQLDFDAEYIELIINQYHLRVTALTIGTLDWLRFAYVLRYRCG